MTADSVGSGASSGGGPGSAALIAALLELDRHVAAQGWEQPPRLFALVRTVELLAAEPELAGRLGPPHAASAALADALSAVEQDDFASTDDLIGDLARISWPPMVSGCAVSLVRSFLPSTVEADVPAEDESAIAYVAAHPERQEVRVVVGVDRDGHRHGLGRLASQPDELLAAEDLVPGLALVLAHTLI